MNYCSLQEAYNVPSFAKKPKNTAPLACGGSGSAPNPSAQPFDPNQEQTALSIEGFSGGGGGSCGSGVTAGTGAAGKTACGKYAMAPDPVTNNIPYTTQANDYDYYCKTFDICPQPKMRITESFAGGQSATTGPTGQQCSPIQAPIYQVPVSDATKKAGASALNASMGPSGTEPTRPMPMRNVDMSNVQGLYDDELDQYLHVKDMKSSPVAPAQPKRSPGGPDVAGFDGADKTPFSNAMSAFSPSKGGRPVLHYEPEPFAHSQTDKWQYIMDMIMFIAAGILIILLCDLLFKIALSIGMKDTFQMMEPYLKEIAELKALIAQQKAAVALE